MLLAAFTQDAPLELELASGQVVSFSLQGEGFGDATETEDGIALFLSGTNEATRLTATSGQRWSLSEFNAGTLGLLRAPQADLTGRFTAEELGELRLRDVGVAPDPENPTDAPVRVSISGDLDQAFFRVARWSEIDVGGTLGYLRAIEYVGGSISANRVGTISMTGSKGIGSPGDFDTQLALVGDGLEDGQLVLERLKAPGAITQSIVAPGLVGTVSAGRLSGASVTSGYTPDAPEAPLFGGTFGEASSIQAVYAWGVDGSSTPAVVDAVLAADGIGDVRLGSVGGGDRYHGVFANTLASLRVGQNFVFDQANPGAQPGGLFHVLLPGLEIVDRTLPELSDGFVRETIVPIDLEAVTNGRRVLSFELGDVQSTLGPTDRLLVYLIDPTDPTSTLLDRGDAGTSLLAVSAESAEVRAGLVRFDGQRAEIDVTALAETTDRALLVFQLLGSGQAEGEVRIAQIANTFEEESQPATPFDLPRFPVLPGDGAVVLAEFQASDEYVVEVRNPRHQAGSGSFEAEVRVRNMSAMTPRNILLGLTGLPEGVKVLDAVAFGEDGTPYISLLTSIAAGGLTPGALSEPVRVRIDNAENRRFAINPIVRVGGPNQAPVLQPINTLEVSPGGYLDVSALASDPDGDRLTFQVIAQDDLPNGRLSSTGSFVFTPAPDQLGSYNFTLVVSDGAATATQDVTINVVDDPIGTSRISGTVLDVDGTPLVSVPLRMGAGTDVQEAFTDANGDFVLELPDGFFATYDTVRVDAQELDIPGVVYPFVAEKMPLVLGFSPYEGYNNVIGRPIYLPKVDVASGSTIDPTQTTMVTNEELDAMVTVAAGSLEGMDGNPFEGVLSISGVPTQLTPAALPMGLIPDLVVTIQPAEMVFTQPAPLTLPNLSGFAPGTIMDLWSINPATGQFDDVGDGRVSDDGSIIETFSGGVLNSSWHFFTPPEPTVVQPENRQEDRQCPTCGTQTAPATSTVDLHGGYLSETHSLVGYQSQGVDRSLLLRYDTFRADPRPIVHFGFNDVPAQSEDLLIANLRIERGSFSQEVAGFDGLPLGIDGQLHAWSLPAEGGQVSAALQANLRTQPTGTYEYTVMTGLLRDSLTAAGERQLTGSMSDLTGSVVVVNDIDSVFGAGWGIAGLQRIYENPDGSVLLVDGDGTQLRFESLGGGGFASPSGDFSVLRQDRNGRFERSFKNGAVARFDAGNRLVRVEDRNGNTTTHAYDAQGRIRSITDPVGLQTDFAYNASGKVASITDPAGRVTTLAYDGFGNLTSITDPDGTTRSFMYDASNRMIGEVDKRGFQETMRYDFAGRAQEATRKDGSTSLVRPAQVVGLFPASQTTNIDAAPTAVIGSAAEGIYVDPNGNTSNRQLDDRGQLILGVDGEGSIGSQERDGENLIRLSVDGAGAAEAMEYDALGNLLSHSRGSGADFGNILVNTSFDELYTFRSEDGRTRGLGSTDVEFYDIAYSSQSGLFGITRDGELSSIDLATGSTTPITMADPGLPTVNGLDFHPDGRLFASGTEGSGSQIYHVDILTGVLTPVLAIAEFESVGDIAFDANGVGYLTAEFDRDNNLVRFDVDATTFEPIGVIDDFASIPALAFDANGQLLGFSTGRDVFSIDTQTGVGTEIDVAGQLPGGTPFGATYLGTLPSSNASIVRYEYDPAFSQITRMVDELGRETVYDIDPANGNVRGVTHPDGATVQYTYNAAGQVRSMTDERGFVTDFEYDGLGRLITLTEAAGTPDAGVTRMEYDAAGNVLVRTDANGNDTAYTYDQLNRLLSVADALGNTWTYEYDQDGNTTRSVDARGNATANTFDELGRLTTSTAADGGVMRYTYDLVGNLATATDAVGNTTRYVYDARNRLQRSVDARGGVTEYGYDRADNLTRVVDPVANLTRFFYDDRNRLVSEVQVGVGEAETFEVDLTQWRELSHLNGNPAPWEVTGDDNDMVRTTANIEDVGFFVSNESFVDARASLIGGVVGGDDDFIGFVFGMTTTIDDIPDSYYTLTWKSADQSAPSFSGAFGEEGIKLLKITDAADVQSNNMYGQIYDGENSDNVQVLFERTGQDTGWDNDVNYTFELVYRSSGTFDIVIRTAEDEALVQRINVTDPSPLNGDQFGFFAISQQGVEYSANFDRSPGKSYIYDQADNLVTTFDRNGRQIEFLYDERDRIVTERWIPALDSTDAPYEIAYSYDLAGNLLTAVDPSSSLAMTYDARNRLAMVDNAGTPGVPQVALEYGYDAVGNRTSMTERFGGQTGAVTTYVYDAINRMTSARQASGSAALIVANKLATMAYNEIGQITTLDRFVDTAGTQLLTSSAFAYDVVNRVTSIDHTLADGTLAERFGYIYDLASRITSIADGGETIDYQYDRTNQLTATTYSDTTRTDETYAYDLNGNRLSTHRSATYVTDTHNRLIEDDTFTYEYDLEGNLTLRTSKADGSTRTFEWDYRNRLTSVTDANGGGQIQQVAAYAYDSADRRILKTVTPYSGGTAGTPASTAFVYDAEDIVLRYEDADGAGAGADPVLTQRVLHGPGIDMPLMVEIVGQGLTLSLLTDHLGTVHAEAASDGTIARRTYDAYGNVTATEGTVRTDYAFTGRELDDETGLMYYRARYYDAEIGRFVGQDPIGFAAGDSNQFRYVFNAPIHFTDPTGEFIPAIILLPGAMAAVGAAFGAAGVYVGGLVSGQAPTWQTYAAGAIGGAVSGGIMSIPATTALGTAGLIAGSGLVGGAVTNATEQGLNLATGVQCSFDLEGFGIDTALGGATSVIGAGGSRITSKLLSGRGSYRQVARLTATQVYNGSWSRVSASTLGKVVAVDALDSLPGAGAGVVGSHIRQELLPTGASCGCP